jgi:hypothetical protein
MQHIMMNVVMLSVAVMLIIIMPSAFMLISEYNYTRHNK